MGTKNKPGLFDCYAQADPDEPMFVLLGRDPIAPFVVGLWAKMRQILRGHSAKVDEASQCLRAMFDWTGGVAGATPEATAEHNRALMAFDHLVKSRLEFTDVMAAGNARTPDHELVVVTKKELEQLKADATELAKLHAGGVDNWEWYGDALSKRLCCDSKDAEGEAHEDGCTSA